MSHTQSWKRLLAELVGMYILVLFGAGTIAYLASKAQEFTLTTAIVFGCLMAFIIYVFGCISGAHVNPAVSLGFALVGRMDWGSMIMYWIVQFLGGILAALTIYWLFDGETGASTGSFTFTDQWKAVFIEALITVVLVLGMLFLSKSWKFGLLGGVAIGCIVAASYVFAGNLTGASANPARSLGPAIMGGGSMKSLWIYFVGPLIGAIVAAILYSIMKASAWSPALDECGEARMTPCCDPILEKCVPRVDKCGNPIVGPCGEAEYDKIYKVGVSKNNQYKFGAHGDHFKAATGISQKFMHQKMEKMIAPSAEELESGSFFSMTKMEEPKPVTLVNGEQSAQVTVTGMGPSVTLPDSRPDSRPVRTATLTRRSQTFNPTGTSVARQSLTNALVQL